MAYNRENYLTKVLDVQSIALLHRKKGLFFKEIYHQYVEKQFRISKRTFDTYLGINARKEIKELQAKKEQNKQLNLFYNELRTFNDRY